MIEITNRTRGPVQIVVRSKKAPRAFTTMIVPGIGSNKNVIYIEDERHTDIVDRVKGMGLITTRQVPNKKHKGE
jgi:hypothetical protein